MVNNFDLFPFFFQGTFQNHLLPRVNHITVSSCSGILFRIFLMQFIHDIPHRQHSFKGVLIFTISHDKSASLFRICLHTMHVTLRQNIFRNNHLVQNVLQLFRGSLRIGIPPTVNIEAYQNRPLPPRDQCRRSNFSAY